MSTTKRFHLTLIHPAIGRRAGSRRYIRAWQMEPLPAATIAALTPPDVDIRFFDDRMEPIAFEAPTDLVAISVETYTARRSYQIASEYRRRGIPVVMGGFHASLCPDEVARYSESVVIGEAEELWPNILDDHRHSRPRKRYQATGRSHLAGIRPDRRVYAGRRYLPIRLVEAGRGCPHHCDFCSVQTMFASSHTARPVDEVIAEVQATHRAGQLVFFIDDNITADIASTKEQLKALIPLKIRWVSQSTIHAAFDEEYLDLLRRSGCRGLLVGFETFNPHNLQHMQKPFNGGRAKAAEAMSRFRRHGIRIYGTFVFGYDHDTEQSFQEALDFAIEEGLFIAAFNHITPFPGTPLYRRLRDEGRLQYDAWWLDERYRYNQLPFRPCHMDASEVERLCLQTRKAFYSYRSMLRRSLHKVHWRDPLMLANYLGINLMHRWDIGRRDGLPLGDQGWSGTLIPAQ